MKQIPIVLVNGFIDAGKTKFINEVTEENTFGQQARTLIISLEQGEREYDKKLLDTGKVYVLTIEDEEDLSTVLIDQTVKKFKPDMVIIEANNMWLEPISMKMPAYLYLQQQITIVDADSFEMYYNNIRQKFVDMIRDSDMVIMNNCEENDKISGYKRSLRLINSQAQYILYDKQDNELHLASDLPYKVDGDIIKIADEHFGIWYIDTFDSHARYDGKTVEFNAMTMLSNKLPSHTFVAGRMAMTCCANDMQLIGHLAVYNPNQKVRNKAWAHITAIVHYVYNQQYGEEEAVLEVKDMFEIPEIKDPTVSLV